MTGKEDEKIGIVVGTEDNFAKLKINIHGTCENCQICTQEEMYLQAENSINAQVGQKVRYDENTDKAVWMAFVLFIFPMLSIFAGIYAGKMISDKIGSVNPLFMIAGGVLGFVISFLIIFLYEKRAKKKFKKHAVITDILS
jgi:sigma-E factor negative regulatory protein RseC